MRSESFEKHGSSSPSNDPIRPYALADNYCKRDDKKARMKIHCLLQSDCKLQLVALFLAIDMGLESGLVVSTWL